MRTLAHTGFYTSFNKHVYIYMYFGLHRYKNDHIGLCSTRWRRSFDFLFWGCAFWTSCTIWAALRHVGSAPNVCTVGAAPTNLCTWVLQWLRILVMSLHHFAPIYHSFFSPKYNKSCLHVTNSSTTLVF